MLIFKPRMKCFLAKTRLFRFIYRAGLNARGEIIENKQSKSRVALNEIFAAAAKWNP